MHAERLSESKCVPRLVLIALAVFLLERGHAHIHRDRQTHDVTDATEHTTHASATTGVG